MKIISKIMGGLGNQMFQYACGKALANRLGATFYLDLRWFNKGNREFMLDKFPNIHYSSWEPSVFEKIMQRIGGGAISYIQESDYSYWSGIEHIRSSAHLSGYWQNDKYFFNIADIIKKDFNFPEFSSSDAKNMVLKIKSSVNSVSIHVRRGDYVENEKTNRIHGTCSLDYYKRALQIIADKQKKPLELYIFSDDPQWISNNFNTYGYTSIIVDIPQHKISPFHDMHLMSLCRHHVLANSSFSWWGAWLSGNDGIIIAPMRWFAEENHNPSLESWIKVE
jgi:hypothetical protein